MDHRLDTEKKKKHLRVTKHLLKQTRIPRTYDEAGKEKTIIIIKQNRRQHSKAEREFKKYQEYLRETTRSWINVRTRETKRN